MHPAKRGENELRRIDYTERGRGRGSKNVTYYIFSYFLVFKENAN